MGKTLLVSFLCLASAMTTQAAEPWKIIENVNGQSEETAGCNHLSIERGILTSARYVNPVDQATEPDDDVNCQVIRTTAYGELEGLLGDNIEAVDSLVVYGPVGGSDFDTMWKASFQGMLSVINLENAQVEDGRIPDNAFWRKEQIGPDAAYINAIRLRRIIFPDDIRSIGDNAFSYAINLEQINMPSSLRSLGEAAFSDCIRLCTDPLVFPVGFDEIGDFAFLNCKALKGAIDFRSVKTIGSGAFFQSGISSVKLPEGLEEIENSAFYACRLREVTIPGTCLTFTGDSHFRLNYELEKASLPEGIREIPKDFVGGCINLTEFRMPESVERIGSGAFEQCRALVDFRLPINLKAIEQEGLSGCSSLKEIFFPSSLEFIGINGCHGLSGVESIVCASAEPPLCAKNPEHPEQTPFGTSGSFGSGDTPTLTPVYVPVGSVDRYREAWGWNYFTNIIESEVAGIADIDQEKYNDNGTIYDMDGRKVVNPIQDHIYIQDGRKFIHR